MAQTVGAIHAFNHLVRQSDEVDPVDHRVDVEIGCERVDIHSFAYERVQIHLVEDQVDRGDAQPLDRVLQGTEDAVAAVVEYRIAATDRESVPAWLGGGFVLKPAPHFCRDRVAAAWPSRQRAAQAGFA